MLSKVELVFKYTRSCQFVKVLAVPTFRTCQLTAPHLFGASGHAAFQRIGRSVGDMLLGGDCHNYGLLATGCLDLVMEEGLKIYDWAALVPVVTGAGGIITDWRGSPLGLKSEGRVLAAGDRAVHQQALERI